MKQESFKIMAWLLVSLLVLSWLSAEIIERSNGISSGNIAIIPIDGYISFSSLGFNQGVNPHTTKKLIEKADSAPNIKAIVLDINSGGGTPVASEMIANALKSTNKTTVAIIRDIGTSGAYWIASAADVVIASKYSITGSIGVRGSFVDYYGLLKRFNMSYERLVGGELKDLGDPFKPLSDEERALLQTKINELHKLFLEDIRLNRNLSQEQSEQIKSGCFYLGGEAKRLGLVDIIGGDAELKAYLMQRLNLSYVSEVKLTPKRSLFERLPSLFVNWKLDTSPRISLN